MSDFIPTITLTHGAGDGKNTACLMTASNMLMGMGHLGDKNSCVCPIIRAFILPTNDAMPIPTLRSVYGNPLLAWEILGTATDDNEVITKRSYAFADWSVRKIAPIALRAADLPAQATILENLPQIKDKESAYAANYAANAAAHAAANAATHAATEIWSLCPEIIRHVASIGDKRPVECAITINQLCEILN